jgi:iron uptake system EfeUOB component EfeO/EfeM
MRVITEEIVMSAKTFEGSVSVVKNTKDEIALKKDAEGKYSVTNASECYAKMTELSKKLKFPINKYSLFIAKDGTEPVMLANRFGNPYIALLPKRGAGSGKKNAVTKLA